MKKAIFLLILLSLILMACGKVELNTPSGFAHYSDESDYFKVISPDGITIKAYEAESDAGDAKNVDLALWTKESQLTLQSKGYQKISSENILSQKGLKGIYTEYKTFYNGENYSYGLTLFIDGDDLYVVESGGKKTDYEKRKGQIMTCIKSFRASNYL